MGKALSPLVLGLIPVLALILTSACGGGQINRETSRDTYARHLTITVTPRTDNASELIRIMNSAPAKKATETCVCGNPKQGSSACNGPSSLTRIVYGTKVPVGSSKYPWITYIRICSQDKEKCVMCGGTIMNRWWVLTAAHCLYAGGPHQTTPEHVVIAAGGENFRLMRGYHVTQMFAHEDYDNDLIENDIALMKVKKPFQFSDSLNPACLPTDPENDYVGQTAIAAGWGATSYHGDVSHTLLQVFVKVVSHETEVCKNGISTGRMLKTKMCGFNKHGDACQGDSGGPLVLADNDKCTLVGIISYGVECATPTAAGVYTRVNQFLDWIKSRIKSDDDCFSIGSGSDSHGTQTGSPCDLSCTSVSFRTGRFYLNGIPSKCEHGVCRSKVADLCAVFKNPCEAKGISPRDGSDDDDDEIDLEAIFGEHFNKMTP